MEQVELEQRNPREEHTAFSECARKRVANKSCPDGVLTRPLGCLLETKSENPTELITVFLLPAACSLFSTDFHTQPGFNFDSQSPVTSLLFNNNNKVNDIITFNVKALVEGYLAHVVGVIPQ